MALKSGFYDSIEGDRTYNANDLNNIYAGVRTDGVVEGTLNNFEVVAGSGMSVDVTPGLAVIRNKWCSNSASVNLTLESGGTLARIDGIYLKADETERSIIPVVVKGTESSAPVKPTPSNNPNTKYLPLAYVSIPSGATSGGFTIEDARSYSGINSAPRTLLWENSNPSLEFGEQEITLSESIGNFETIMVETTDGQLLQGKAGEFSKTKYKKTIDSTITNTITIETTTYHRTYEASDMNVLFSHQPEIAVTHKTDLNSAEVTLTKASMDETDNTKLIPYRVYGINRK